MKHEAKIRELGVWELAVLALLREAPMHPYQMQRLLRERHKDEILALKRGSLYHAIGRLERAGLIEAGAISRDGRRPERTTYAITGKGCSEFLSALRGIVARPRREPSEFMAAMSFLVHLTPAEAVPQLAERCARLEREIERHSRSLEGAAAHVERINLIESEYLVAMLRAEAAWVRGLMEELSTGRLAWEPAQIFEEAQADRSAAGLKEEA